MISQLIEEKNKLKYSSLQGIIVEMALLRLCLGDEVAIADKRLQAALPKKEVKSSIPVGVQNKVINDHQDRGNRVNPGVDGTTLSPEDDKEKKEQFKFDNEASEERLLSREVTNFAEENIDKAQPSITTPKAKTSVFSKHDEMKYYKLLCDEISMTNSGQAMFLKRGEPSLEDEGHLSIIYSIENINFYHFVNKPELVKNFETILSQKTGKTINISIKLEEENFAELDLLEKTMRIVNDDTVRIIKSEDEVKK